MEMQPESRRGFSYGDLLGDSFRIFWRNKFLWVLGLLAALIGAIFSAFGTFGTLFQPGPSGEIPALSVANVGVLIGVGLVVFLVLLLLSVFISVVTAGAMTNAVAEIDSGRGSGFGAAWRAGVSHFWRVLMQGILKFLIAIGLALALVIVCGIPVLLTFVLSQSVGLRIAMAVIFGLLFFVLLFVIFIPMTIVFQYALRNLVVDGSGIVESFSGGYRTFRRNIGRSLLVWLISAGFGLVVGIVSFLISIVVSLAVFGAAFGFATTGASGVPPATAVITQLANLVPSTIISVFTIAFFSVYWTVAYLRVKGQSRVSSSSSTS